MSLLIPIRHNLEQILNVHLEGAGIWDEREGSLFRNTVRKTNQFTLNGMTAVGM